MQLWMNKNQSFYLNVIKQHGRPSATLVGGVKPLVDPRSSSDTLRPPDDDDQIIIMVNMIVIMMIMMIMMMIINFSRTPQIPDIL